MVNGRSDGSKVIVSQLTHRKDLLLCQLTQPYPRRVFEFRFIKRVRRLSRPGDSRRQMILLHRGGILLSPGEDRKLLNTGTTGTIEPNA